MVVSGLAEAPSPYLLVENLIVLEIKTNKQIWLLNESNRTIDHSAPKESAQVNSEQERFQADMRETAQVNTLLQLCQLQFYRLLIQGG
jgi:hypothetical protein